MLEGILIDCQRRGGLDHKLAIARLKRYLDNQNIDKILREMREIKDVALLKYMMEAGLRRWLYHEYIAYMAEIGEIGEDHVSEV